LIIMDRSEAYQQGLTSYETPNLTLGPPWAKQAGWDGVGIWIVIDPIDLCKSVPGLTMASLHQTFPYILYKKAPNHAFKLSKFFEDLEDNYINLVAARKYIQVVCEGATLISDESGGSYMSGFFHMTFEVNGFVHKLMLPRKLVISERFCDVTLPGGADTIVSFDVDARLVMSALELSELQWKSGGKQDEEESRDFTIVRTSASNPQFMPKVKSGLKGFFLKH
jgi:hypothetical protein